MPGTVMRTLNILGIAPHPDDMESLCGGTLAKYARGGHKVTIATMTNGDKGHLEIPPKELGKIRLEEGKRAAAVLGAEHLWIGFRDTEVYHNRQTVLKLVDVIRRVRADIVFTTYYQDYHPDHINTSVSVVQAVFNAGLPQIKTKFPAYTTTRVYYCETLFGMQFEPDFWVDITDTIDLKLKALSEHKTQVEWLKKHHGIDLLESVRLCSMYRGLQAKVEYAEAFKQVRKHMQLKAIDLPP